MEILNCEYENHNLKIKKHEENEVGIIVSKFKDNLFFDLEEDIEKFYILENMKIYESRFAYRSKSVGRNINPNLERAELIKNLILQTFPENSIAFSFKKGGKKVKIDYLYLKAIAEKIIRVLTKIKDKKDFPKILIELMEQKNFNKILEPNTIDNSLKEMINNFKKVEEISFGLSGNNDDNFELNYILIFYFFYDLLFPNVKSVTINLDLIKMSEKYNQFKNPYDFEVKKVDNFSENFENIILANFLVTCIVMISNETLSKLKIKASESYIIEINNIIKKQFQNKNYKEKIMKENGLILLKKLMKIKNINNLSFSINCLDRFLFNEIISFIATHQNIQILELNLFYNPKFFNIRKMYLNYVKDQNIYEIDPNIIDQNSIVYFPYIETLEKDIQSIVEEEKIPDLIFPAFQKNLNMLKIILNEYIKNFVEFSLDISPYDELIKYENYNVQIILFILAIMFSLEKSKNIKSIRLKCSNLDYAFVSQIWNKIGKLISLKLIDFSECRNLSDLTLVIQGFSLMFDFSKLPFNSLEKLDISISAENDMEKLDGFLKKNKDYFKNLVQLNISFPLVYNIDNLMKPFIKIFENLPHCLKILNINIENIMKMKDIIEIIKTIQKNKIPINCELKCDCFELEELLSENNMENLRTFLKSIAVDNVNIENYDIIKNSKRGIKLCLNLPPSKNMIKAIIFCVNKIIKKSKEVKKNDNKKLFCKLFKFLEIRQNFSIILN